MNCSRVDHGSTVTLKIRGELDALSAPELRPILDQVVEDQPRHVVVDLSDLRLVDSSGVGALVSLYKRVRARGGAVSVRGLKDQPLAIFRLLKLERVMSPEAAAAAA